MNIASVDISQRVVGKADQALIYRLFCSVRGPELSHSTLTPQQQHEHLLSQFSAMHSTYQQRFPNGVHNVIVWKGKDIGRIYTNESADEIRILDVIIDPAYRNHGIGSHIMRQLTTQSDKTTKALRFYVWMSNKAAQRFYTRHGCQPVRQDGAYILFERLPQ
ncbi:MAG: GNAT family N-acetyltransferase [Candidatus Promineifilaceae bacterium]